MSNAVGTDRPRSHATSPLPERGRLQLSAGAKCTLVGWGVLLVGACSNNSASINAPAVQSAATDRPAEVITVVNKTADPIGYFARDRASADLVDLRSRIPTNNLRRRAAAADSGVLLLEDIAEYQPGDDVQLSIYRVSGDEAILRGVVFVPAAQLAAPRARIVVSDSAIAASSR